jgi:peptide chain release factor
LLSELKLTKDTELGSNETIKCATPVESNREARKREKAATEYVPPPTLLKVLSFDVLNQMLIFSSVGFTLPPSAVHRHYSALKKAHKMRQLPEVKECDLVESFVRGKFDSFFHIENSVYN